MLLIEYIFTKKQETKRKMSVKVKPWLKNGLYTSAFNNMLAELIVNDTLESILLHITIFFLLNRTNGMSYPGLLSLPYNNPIQSFHCGSILYCHCCCFCSVFDFYLKSTKMWRFSLLMQCY